MPTTPARQVTAANDCRADEDFDMCGSACHPTCITKNAEVAACPKNCVPGCYCKANLFRNADGACVLRCWETGYAGRNPESDVTLDFNKWCENFYISWDSHLFGVSSSWVFKYLNACSRVLYKYFSVGNARVFNGKS